LTLALGAVASTLETKARWAYSEIMSSRTGERYQNHTPLAPVAQLALAGTPFEDLPPDCHQILGDAVTATRTRLIRLMEQHRRFVLKHWSKHELANSYADAYFNTPRREIPLRFGDFLRWPRGTGPDGRPAMDDPRIVADGIAPGTVPFTDAAPIAVGSGGDLIVDGYLRCILFMRDAPASARLPVWVGT
jgi:hypothetical protein